MCERPKSVAMSQVENGAVNGARINVTSQEATSRESMDVAAVSSKRCASCRMPRIHRVSAESWAFEARRRSSNYDNNVW
jgi:ribosomal protein L37E